MCVCVCVRVCVCVCACECVLMMLIDDFFENGKEGFRNQPMTATRFTHIEPYKSDPWCPFTVYTASYLNQLSPITSGLILLDPLNLE